MSRRVFLNQFILAFIVFSLVSCSKFRKIEKSEDWRVKFEAAINYYENKDYYRAATLFDQILPIVRGLPDGEKTQFYYAYCQYHQDLYLLAAHHFKTFYETYTRSEFAEEAEYMHAYSLYASSPEYNLDQTSSIEAVVAMQSFVNRHPNSKLRNDGSKVIDEIQEKLENKGYENAKQYYKLERYKAAVIAFESFRKDFPDSKRNEEILYLKFVSQYNLADKSLPDKQLDRYKQANEMYIEFLDEYPTSQYLKEAEKKYGISLERVSQLAKK